MTFQDFKLHRNILQVIQEENYTEPTPIQKLAIPIILDEFDLVGCAQTGTGKTAAFAMPILNYLHPIVGSKSKRKVIRTLVLAPTRELAHQIQESFETYGRYMNMKSFVIYGGVNQQPQVDAIKAGVDILIATPGRLLDLYKQKHIDLNQVHHLVIDEADLMLDMGFINDVKKVIKLTPVNRQTMLFSATMPLPIRELADEFLNNPKFATVGSPQETKYNIIQKVYFVEKEHKRKLLVHVLNEEQIKNVIVFVRTKQGADSVVETLTKNGFKADSLHGDKTQAARTKVLDSFKNKEIDILVATDVAARGIDIEQLPFVINFDLPNIPETYVHRIGRTGRAGNEGLALSFCGKDEKTYWKDIEKLIRLQVKEVKNHPFPWVDKVENPNAKKDFRNKKKITNNNNSNTNPNPNSKKSNSRKSDNSKKNKKRWY